MISLEPGEYDVRGEIVFGYYRPIYRPIAGGKIVYLGMTKSEKEAQDWIIEAQSCDDGSQGYGDRLSRFVTFAVGKPDIAKKV